MSRRQDFILNGIITSPEPNEYYQCTCGLRFNYVEGAREHLAETFEHSVKRVLNTFDIDVEQHR
jgi:hypothetical protein